MVSGQTILSWARLVIVLVCPPCHWSIFLITWSSCLVFHIDSATLVMANIALPTIKTSLGLNEGSLQWVLTAYALTVRINNLALLSLDECPELTDLNV